MAARTYSIRTFGCQMNVHDSERAAGLLEAAGWRPAPTPEEADLILLNTCAVRENADNRLYGTLGHLKATKDARRAAGSDLTIAVGGCLAQKDGATIVAKAPWVDVVVGTHNLGSLDRLLAQADSVALPVVELVEQLETFPSALPAKRHVAHHAWVAISVGCNNSCTFCIVPALRGPERSRTFDEIVTEVRELVDDGVIEVTLLGQNVNSWGRDLYGRSRFAELLRGVGAIDGLERVRFTSPHPRDFTEDVLVAMAETPSVCEHLHLPLQSGSDRVLRRMRRSYRAARYLALAERTRQLMPDAALTTDIIVGFPGETDEDFEQTLEVVEEVGFDQAFTFQYSPRPGTPAADMPDQVPADVVAERYPRLEELVRRQSLDAHRRLVGRTVELLVDEPSKRDSGRVSARTRGNHLVHVPAVETTQSGALVEAVVTEASTNYAIAGSPTRVLRPAPAVKAATGTRPNTGNPAEAGASTDAVPRRSLPVLAS